MIHITTHSGYVVFQKALTTAVVKDKNIALFLQRGIKHDLLKVSYKKDTESFVISGIINGKDYCIIVNDDGAKLLDIIDAKALGELIPDELDILYNLPQVVDEKDLIKTIRSGFFDLVEDSNEH